MRVNSMFEGQKVKKHRVSMKVKSLQSAHLYSQVNLRFDRTTLTWHVRKEDATMEYAYGHTTTPRHSEKNDKRKVLTYACINVKINKLFDKWGVEKEAF